MLKKLVPTLLIALFASLALITPRPAYAQESLPFTEDITATNVLAGVRNGSVAWGDYDNDGDIDILLTGDDGNNPIASVYENVDGAFSVNITATNVLTGVRDSSVAWGDYDNDGDLDILLTGQDTNGDPIANVYENTNGTFSLDVAATAVLPGVDAGSVAWGDYDNDGDLDILLTGNDGNDPIANVYENTNGTFSLDVAATNILTGVEDSSVAWGDYDNDGDLDILLTGDDGTIEIAGVYKNTNGTFSLDTAAINVLPGVRNSSVAWGDYDNDGDLDILLTGRNVAGDPIAGVYKNTGGAFSVNITATNILTDIRDSSVAWGDYDNDGDLDILLTGRDINGVRIAIVYRNNAVTVNILPGPPSGLSALVAGQTVTLSWAAPTPFTYTTAYTGLTYNLWMGSGPGLLDVLAPMSLDDGYRQVVALGNVQHGLTATLNLLPGDYYWSVQAVDHTFAGSPFATEGSFTVQPVSCVEVNITDVTSDSPVEMGATMHFTATVAGDTPITYIWNFGDGSPGQGDVGLDTTSYVYPSLGTFTVTLAVFNSTSCPSVDAYSFQVTVNPPACDEVAGVDLNLTTVGTVYTDTNVQFSADVTPNDATTPYTYRLTIDGAPGEVMTSSDDPLVFTDTFATTGTHTVEIAVWNCAMTETQAVTDIVTFTVYEQGVCVGLTGITIHGDTSGTPGIYTFTTSYEPTDASIPIAYLWDNSDTMATSARNLDVGTHDYLMVVATNCTTAMVFDTHTISINSTQYIYLPLVVRSYP